MKFNTIVLLFVSAAVALRVREDPAPGDKAKTDASIEKAAKGEENAKEAKDEDWQNPYGHVGTFGEYEGKIGGSSKLINGTKVAIEKKEAEAAGKLQPDPEAKLGDKIDGEIKEEEKSADTPAKEEAKK